MLDFLAKLEGIHLINLALGIPIFVMFIYNMMFAKTTSAPAAGASSPQQL
jgi:hypothetical protein